MNKTEIIITIPKRKAPGGAPAGSPKGIIEVRKNDDYLARRRGADDTGGGGGVLTAPVLSFDGLIRPACGTVPGGSAFSIFFPQNDAYSIFHRIGQTARIAVSGGAPHLSSRTIRKRIIYWDGSTTTTDTFQTLNPADPASPFLFIDQASDNLNVHSEYYRASENGGAFSNEVAAVFGVSCYSSFACDADTFTFEQGVFEDGTPGRINGFYP